MPHLIWNPNSQYEYDEAAPVLKMIKRENTLSFTDIIVTSVDSNIYKLYVEIKNTLAERYCTLTGSDDLSYWYTINDSIAIKPEKSSFGDTNSEFKLEFPPVNYKYFKIHITNDAKAPYNIINVLGKGKMREFYYGGKWNPYYSNFENPASTIIQKDSGSYSYFKITQPSSYHFNKIGIKLSGAKYFKRNARIYFPESSNHSFSNPGVLKESIVLSNNSTLEYYLQESNQTTFYVVIQNDDNPPLKIEAVKTYSAYMLATAWFEKGKRYKMIFGNKDALEPKFDLKLADIDKTQIHPNVTVNTITQLPQIPVTITPVNKNKTMMWLIIAAAVLILTFFTYKLITDINKSKS
ncbi:MAG: hypothetical protein QM737_08315 [Ferruginibacter sp.]